ncbi:MAG: hypothetical protein AB8G96_02915 [Phycisphaerales bacterium]
MSGGRADSTSDRAAGDSAARHASDSPDTPGSPDSPDSPGTPGTPGSPNTPGSPDTPAAPASELAARLGGIQVGVREDLTVVRHVFRGEVAYVITDPVTFRSHRLGADEYRAFTAVRTGLTLSEIHRELIAGDVAPADDPDTFYRFILTLHASGFLSLPISDPDGLHERFQRRRAAGRRSLLAAPLYLKIPLVQPDAMLRRTLPLVGWLFSRPFVVFWALLLATSLVMLALRFDEAVTSAAGLFRIDSILATWFVLIGLKVVHEFGHAWACRRFGGVVPEMGVVMILMTPCAYVDASASWGFEDARRRMIVNLGGMYFESFIAIPAFLAWGLLEPGSVRDLMMLIAITASVTTIGFNINPLMRFDGYFVLSDLIGVPNLQGRATGEITGLARQFLLGLPHDPAPVRDRAALVAFGIASTAYKISLLIAISTLLAVRFGAGGLLAAGAYLAFSLVGRAIRLARWLLGSPETQPVRRRAIGLATLVFGAIPAAVCMIPVSLPVTVEGVVDARYRDVVHARQSGTLASIEGAPMHAVAGGDILVVLDNPDLEPAITVAARQVEAAEVRFLAAAAQPSGDGAAERLDREREHAKSLLAERIADGADLTVRAADGGRLLRLPASAELGRWVEAGEPLAIIGRGPLVVRALVPGHRVATTRPSPGMEVSIHWPANAWRAADAGVAQAGFGRGFAGARTADEMGDAPGPAAANVGRIEHVAATAGRTVRDAALARAGGGNISVNPETGEAESAYLEVLIEPAAIPPDVVIGSRVRVRLPGEPATLARRLYRRIIAFRDRVAAG